MKHNDIFPISLAVGEAVRGAHTEAKTAGEALSIASQYLRKREVMPPELADYVADAFEIASLKPKENQSEALLLELGLMALNRRPVAVPRWEVAMFVDDNDNGPTERQRILAAAANFDIGETTARRLLELGREDLEEVARIHREEE